MDRYIFYGVATNTNADGSVKDVTISQMDETVSTNKNVAADVVWSRTKQTLDPATGLLSEKDPVGGGLAPPEPPGKPYPSPDRSWYKKAKDSKGKPRWTNIYTFSSTGMPGITYVFPVLDKDGNWDEWETLVSIDIELSDLSKIATYAKLQAFGKRPNSTTTGFGASVAKFSGGSLASSVSESDVWDSSHIHIINKEYLLASTNPKFTDTDMAGMDEKKRLGLLSSNREDLEKERAVEAKKLVDDSFGLRLWPSTWTTFSQLKKEYVSKEDVGTPFPPLARTRAAIL